MAKKYYACVYGGANDKISDRCKNDIQLLGNLIAKHDFSLVYGAGATGCMGAVARGVKENDGYVMGISPNFISEFEEIFPCDNTVMVDTMAERKTLMEKHADIFFIAPGGIGTMDEFFQVLTLKYLNRHSAPIVILNINGFYDALLVLIDCLVKQNAVTQEIYRLFDVVTEINESTISEMLEQIKNK